MKIGIDIGGSHIAVGLVDNEYKLIAKKDISIKELNSDKSIEEKIEETIVKFIRELLIENDLKEQNIELIGIGSPGTIKDGIIYNAVNLGIDGFNIKKALSKYFNTNIYVENDCKCSGICEKEIGSLKNYDDSVFLAIGTGIGGAAFMGNKMLKPKRYSGFEFGHMIINKNGNECNCGNTGCFEAYASMKKFNNDALKKLNIDKNISGREIRHYIECNLEKEDVKKFLKEYIENLSIGIISIINVFEPEALSFGGGFAYFDDILTSRLKENLKGRLFNEPCPVISVATYKNDAGLIGATMLDKYQEK